MPLQPSGARGVEGRVEIASEFVGGLKDLEGFSHIILIYHFHLSRGYCLEVTPCLDSEPHGIFAARAPKRPNPIGISAVRLTGMEQGTLFIKDIDVVDGTPLLDIKPYVPEFDSVATGKIGWLSGKAQGAGHRKSDNRFL